MRGFKNFKGSDARCPSIHFLFYDGNCHSTNKYEISSNTSDSEDIEIVEQQENYLQNKKILKPGKHHYKKPNNISKTDKHEQYNESESEIRRNTSSQSPSVVIVGDSMIKHLDKRRLQRQLLPSPTRLERKHTAVLT